MRTFKLTLAYDGTDFAGWQVQPNERTVQAELESAIQRITSAEVRVVGSGRTDAGVHAYAQVASFESDTRLEPLELQRALNAELPRDVAVLHLQQRDGFHALRDAVRKRYRYVIHDGPVRDVFQLRYAWHIRQALDCQAMQRAAQPLIGEHDFCSFQTSGSPRQSTRRTVFALDVVRVQAELIHVEIEADGFLYNMVRAIVGTLVDVGLGRVDEQHLARALAAEDRSAAGVTAPPQGLYLLRVDYDAPKNAARS